MGKTPYTKEELAYAVVLGKRLRKIRKHRKLTLKQLSEKIDKIKSVAQLSKYENGESLPNPYVIMEIATTLKINISWLVTGKD